DGSLDPSFGTGGKVVTDFGAYLEAILLQPDGKIIGVGYGAGIKLARYVGTGGASSTPPVIVPQISGTLGSNGWYRSNVTVTWSVTGSGIVSSTGCGPTTLTADTPGVTLTCSATNSAGPNSASATIKIDKTAPVLNPIVSPNPVELNG